MTAASAPATIDLDHLRTWIGKTETTTDLITPRLAQSLRATLFMEPGALQTGDAAPLTVHWCLSPAIVAASLLSRDGHPTRGGFLPPVPLPRRMWAGAKTEYRDHLRVGDEVTRHSHITDVALKHGSTGTLCFVTVEHVISSPRGEAIHERHDIVYRDDVAPGGNKTSDSAKAAGPKADHRRDLVADPVLLFRYSAITFNGHRIHYDQPYVTAVEGYPGLVVHGPLQAALLIEFAASLRGKPPRTFTHRGVHPLFEGPFSLNAKETAKETDSGLELWSANPQGTPTMKGVASW